MKQPIYCEFDLASLSRSPRLLAVAHTDDTDTEQLELRVKQDGVPIELAGAAVTARIVTAKENYLLSDNVACTVNESGNILIPFDNAVIRARSGELKIEVNLTRGGKVLTLQFPLRVKFNPSILDTAEVTPASRGTVPELLREAREQLSRVEGFVTEEAVNEIVDGKDFATNADVQDGFTEMSRKVNLALANKADKATALAGYGITDAYTKEETDAAVANSAAAAKNRAEVTGGVITPEMERGSIRNNPTDYVSTVSYIRTKTGYTMWLNPGAVIGLSDYSNAKFFVWLTRPNGTIAKSAALSSDYTVQEFGFYQLVVSRNPVAALTDEDVAALTASIRIKNTAAVGEQGAPALAPLLLGRHPYDYPYVAFTFDAANETVVMEIPRNSKILIPGGNIDLGASGLTVNCVVSGKNSVKIVYDKTDQTVKAISWDSTDNHHILIAVISYSFKANSSNRLQMSVSINASYRINNRCAGMPFSEVLAPVAIGYDSGQRRNYVAVDTVNKKIIFPASTLIFAGEANGFLSLNAGKQLVLDYSGIPLGASAYYGVMKLYFNTVTKQIFISPRNSIQYGMYPLVAIVRVRQTAADTTLPSISINAPAVIDNHFGGFVDQLQSKNGLIKQISHRGCNTEAPENTLPAFRLAKKRGFDAIETDVQRTADGKYICIHDSSINDRVAQNVGDLTIPVNIANIVLAQAQQYDVGKVKGEASEKYQGTRIPTLEEALQLCRAIGLTMYIELKRETLYTDVSAADQETYVREIMQIIQTNGMMQNVAITSGAPELLAYVKAICPGATLVYGCDTATAEIVHKAIALKNSNNEVVLNLNIANCQIDSANIDSIVTSCAENDIQMGAWFANYDGAGYILKTHPYVSRFMCNSLLPGNTLYDNYIN